MRIAVLGGGPPGLYLASLWKGQHPRDEVPLFEQNPADATWGFGVVFSDRALEFLREDDPGTADLIAPRYRPPKKLWMAGPRALIWAAAAG